MNKNNPVSPKVGASAVAAALALIIVWVLDTGFAIDVPGLVEGAFVIVLTAVGGWLKRDPLRDDYIADHSADGL